MKRILPLLASCLVASLALAADPLATGFANPPEQTKPWCYWYWISDNTTKEGITRDLEAMARVGIGEALIGNIFLDDVPAGKIKVLTPEWWGMIEHAIREGGRVGVNIGMFNCPGWSQSGGPWIKPAEAMRYLATSETRVTGPQQFAAKLAAPKEQFQDVAVLAFPAPQQDADSLANHAPKVTCAPAVAEAQKLVDGDPATSIQFPAGAAQGRTPFTVELAVAAPFTARSLQIIPTEHAFGADCELRAAAADGRWQTVRRFKCDRSNMSTGVGFMPRGPVAVSFPAVTANKFQLEFTGVFTGGRAALAEVNLSSAARLQAFVEKQLGKMHPTPLPMWDTYLWPTQAEPDSAKLVVPAAEVRELTKQLAADGTLTWDVPAGEWIIQRIGMTPTGMKNSPASPEGQGLEVDKLNRALAQRHFDAFIGEVLRRMPAADRRAFKRVIADSYEMGSQNWTDGFDAQFRRRYGYDPKPWLPVLSGRLVGSADQSERFLWDLRRLVADRVATDYVGGLRDACKPNGLGLWLENYGHWGFPSEFLKYGSESDRIGGEYWVTGDLGSIECRAASSCANTYGKPFVSAESFTGGPAFQNAPAALKARGDWAFCEGVNHFVLHVYIQQPWEDKVPGVNAWFGTEFNRHNTWFEQSKAWIDYLRRCCWLLQQGNRVADVAYFIGEDAPKMTGVRKPELPPGRDFDYINADVIEKSLELKDGVLTLPHGTTYRVLVLPELGTMRPAVLRKVRDLVKAGATVLGPPPSRSPSLEDYPKCDAEVRRLAAELWGEFAVPALAGGAAKPAEGGTTSGERAFGKGRIIWGRPLADVLGSLGSATDFEASAALRFTHRRAGDTDIYFVASPKAAPLSTTAAFRAGDKAPEFWWPDSGRIERPAVYEVTKGIVRLPLAFGPHGSVFVVFRDQTAAAAERIVSVKRDGREILGTRVTPFATGAGGVAPNNFTIAAWVKPADATELGQESNRGAGALGWKRNDLFAAPHGNQFASAGHAGCGLAVGTNGACVLEHAGNYFTATLVHPASLGDWTHMAVVYRDGQPSLYLNGALAHTGLRSEYVVHSGAAAGALAHFRGQAGECVELGRALSDAEVAALAGTTPRTDRFAGGPALSLTRQGAQTTAKVMQPGEYELLLADGRSRKLAVPVVPPALPLDGAWEVQFTPGWGAPERVTFGSLMDWTEHSDPGVRHFSGQATYRKRFNLPQPVPPNTRLLLDLGAVRDLATVRLNGQSLGTLWLAPFQWDITSNARPGENTLEVEVVNVWNNRLVGDAALPLAQRRTFLAVSAVKPGAPLLPAGLLGPVSVRRAVDAVVRY
jgi:hypothetical protein